MVEQPFQVMPPLSEEDDAALGESVRLHGVLVPVEEDEYGNILDGHHRVKWWHHWRAEGVKLADYPRIIRPGLTDAEKRAHARALNLSRRHLTREQRRELIEDQLRETPEQSDRQIADALGVTNKTVATRRQHLVATEEIPQLKKTVGADGKSRPARRAAVIAKNGMEAKRVQRVLETVPAGDFPDRTIDARQTARIGREHRLANPPMMPLVTIIGGADLRVGDMRDVLADIADCSVPLILTDPPYCKDDIPCYETLSRLAARILTDDGVLVAYAGSYYLPECMTALGSYLDYHIMLCLLHQHGGHGLNSRFVNQRFKPLLVYTKKGHNRRPRWMEDVIRGQGREKDDHEWQQGLGEAMWLIEKLTDPGELVVDPFLGSGTTAAAAVKLGRRFVGADINPGAVAVAKERLEKLEAA
jgi:hypothetical protein